MIARRINLSAQLPVFLFLISYFLFTSCSPSNKISRSANILLKDSAVLAGHVGINFFEPSTGKTWYSHNADKFFIPASNTKLFTLYAGLKYLPDSLPGIRYHEANDTTFIEPTGDPTFLHSVFDKHPILEFLKTKRNVKLNFPLFSDYLGKGWAWDDYKEYYMAQRSSFPMYGNVAAVGISLENNVFFYPAFFRQFSRIEQPQKGFSIEKPWDTNEIIVKQGNRKWTAVPFRPDDTTVLHLLTDTLHRQVTAGRNTMATFDRKVVYSQPADSMFKIMMHQSDNFFAEQTLLMASNEKLGEMDDGKMISYILNNDLIDIPQTPKWVDGSGLSRYNLFTPKSLVYILQKLQTEFGIEKMKTILPTGGEGTLENYYKSDSSYIYAKTGTLSNNLALSGYVITRKNKLLLFSVMVNNFPGGATPVRRAIERFIQGIIIKN